MGLIVFLCKAAEVLGREDLRSSAEDLSRGVLARRAERGHFSLMSAHGFETPGFMAGLSGIGYALNLVMNRSTSVDPLFLRFQQE